MASKHSPNISRKSNRPRTSMPASAFATHGLRVGFPSWATRWRNWHATSSPNTTRAITRSLSVKWKAWNATTVSHCSSTVANTGAWRPNPLKITAKRKSPGGKPGLSTFSFFRVLAFGASARPRRLRAIAQFLAIALHFAQGVNRLVLRFVISARTDFPKQAHGDELDSADKQRNREQQQRPVLRHDVLVIENLVAHQKHPEQKSASRARKPQHAEKLQRPGRIIQQEFHHDQVEEHANGPPDSIIGLAGLAIRIRNRHFGDARSRGAGQRRNKAVQLAVKLDLLQNFPPVRLEGGPKIMQIDPGKLGHQPVRNAARHAAHQPVVSPLVAPAAYQIVAFFDFFKEARNLFRVMLQIAVHGDDDFAAG